MKILSIHDLQIIRKRAEHHLSLREESNEKVSEKCCGLASGTAHLQILICGGTGCKASSSQGITENLQKAIERNGITDKVDVITVGCFGFCEKGPIVKIIPDNTFYTQVTPEDAEEIISEHIIGGRRIERLLYIDPKTEQTVSDSKHMDFYRKQLRIALRNCGFIDSENIEEYIAREGYFALADCLLNKQPADVIDVIKRSGLRGRGGGGFPTGLKWEFASKQVSDVKYVVCNADEGDPGAYMDRSILESNPHDVIEGMMIAAYAIGATEGWFYIRAEYPLAVERIEKAIKACKKNRLLGNNIMNSGFNFNIDIRLGAGAFVCGEETALIHSIEGKRGTPRPRPPYPTEVGLWDKPSCINNVETLGNVASIILKGADWFASFGTETSKGTKVFALTGQVEHSGLIEVPMGTTINEIVNEIGGGVPNGKKLKAVQTGGPSGGVIPLEYLDLPVCYEELKKVGSIMGSGGMIVIDDTQDMVSLANFYLDFTVDESCGKCAPCRIGGKQMLLLLEKINKGKGTRADIEELRKIAHAMQKASLCGLGQTAPNPVLSTLKFYENEYLAKVEPNEKK